MNRSSLPRVQILEPRAGGTYLQYSCDQRSRDVQYGRASVDVKAGVGVTCGFRRCADFDPANAPGQDYVTVRASPNAIVAVVADGVSQSFFGDLAAAAVARSLLDELWTHHQASVDVARVDALLARTALHLRREVAALKLPADMPELQKDALERTRKSGSQAVFAALVFRPASQTCDVLQVGDVTAVAEVGGKVQLLEVPPEERWSSASDKCHTRHRQLRRVTKIVLKTDGVGAQWAAALEAAVLTSPDAFAAVAQDLHIQDDLAFAAVVTTGRRDTESVQEEEGKTEPSSVSPPAPPNASPPLPLVRIGVLLAVVSAVALLVVAMAMRVGHRRLETVMSCAESSRDKASVALRMVNRSRQGLIVRMERVGASGSFLPLKELAAGGAWTVAFNPIRQPIDKIKLRLFDISGARFGAPTFTIPEGGTCTIAVE